MDSLSLFASQTGAAFGQPNMPATRWALTDQPVPNGPVIAMKFEKVFSALLGEASPAPATKSPAMPINEEQEKQPVAMPVLFLPMPLAQNPAPLSLHLLNLSWPKPEKSAVSDTPRDADEPSADDKGTATVATTKSVDRKITAFDGRLLAIEESAPPATPPPTSPKPASPAGGRTLATHPVTPPTNRSGENESDNRQTENAFAMYESHPIPDSEAAQEQTSEPSVTPPKSAELTEPQLRAPAANGINVRLGDDPASTVHLRVAERAGQIHFDVRTANVELASSLREGLPDLIRNLQSSGYQAEIWNSGKLIPATLATASGAGEFGDDAAGQRQRRESPPKQQNKNTTRRKSNFTSAS